MKLRNKKTGVLVDFLTIDLVGEGKIEFCFIAPDGDERDWIYNSLAELNEEWEDYEPAEPLIKDEKVRKAVRVWAEVVGKEETFVVSYNSEYHDCCIYTAGLSCTAMIDLGIDLNINEGSYTIAELCGEEKE